MNLKRKIILFIKKILEKSINRVVNSINIEKLDKWERDIGGIISLEVQREVKNYNLYFYETVNSIINKNKDKITQKETIPNLKKQLLDNYYLSFENRFRGSRESIIQRYKNYLNYIPKNTSIALDIGCGRGEWVELLEQQGIESFGIDLNEAMINEAKKYTKNIQNIDAFEFLEKEESNKYDLISMFHIIEHIPYEELLFLLIEVKRVLKGGGVLLVETPNPANIYVGAYEFYKDPTHLNPLPSDVIMFLLDYLDYKDLELKHLNYFPENMKVNTKTKEAEFINKIFFDSRDYLIVAKKI